MKRLTNADKVKTIRKKTRPASASRSEMKPVRSGSDFQEGQRVALRISRQTRIGYTAIVNETHEGILYKNEVFQPLKNGQRIDGFIKKLRDDKRIDLSLYEPGYKKINALAKNVIDTLNAHGGFVAVTDNSSPERISALFGISKRTYKQIVGNLYKKRWIVFEADGIRLIKTDIKK